jgi:high-affinity Fe2+/Pb2+ permease
MASHIEIVEGVCVFASSLVTLRGGLEAALIVGIVLGVLRQLSRSEARANGVAGLGFGSPPFHLGIPLRGWILTCGAKRCTIGPSEETPPRQREHEHRGKAHADL